MKKQKINNLIYNGSDTECYAYRDNKNNKDIKKLKKQWTDYYINMFKKCKKYKVTPERFDPNTSIHWRPVVINGIAKKNIRTGQAVTKKDIRSVHDYTKKSLITIPRKIDLDYLIILLIMFILGALTVIFITWIMAVLGGKV